MNRWFPVTRSAEVVPRHIAQTQLLGHEIALWRTDAGVLNAWQNRCPHRGVRLSIGIHTGNELRCQYHAWRFASGDGQCTYIPAHPSQKPASSIHVKVHAVLERYHLVWVNLDRDAREAAQNAAPEVPTLSTPESGPDLTLRSIFVNAPATCVRDMLGRAYPAEAASSDAFKIAARDAAQTLTFLLQPVSDTQTLIHGLLHQDKPETRIPLATLRHYNAQLSSLRDGLENQLSTRGATADRATVAHD